MNLLLEEVRARLFAQEQIDKETALQLVLIDEQEELYMLADEVRRHFMGNYFDLCSIINAKSGNCTQNCRFCAQSARYHTGIDTYAIAPEAEVMMIAEDNDQHGVHRLSLVTSGRTLTAETVEELSRLYGKMGASTELLFCASCGLLNDESTRELKKAGVMRYHCNLEASKGYFPSVCSTHTWEEKVATLNMARRHGLSLCSGGIIGMDESMKDRLDMAFELRELGVKSIPVNIFTPIAGTPLANLSPLPLAEVLTTVALFRLINPEAVIRMAGGRQQLGDEQYRCFTSGANGAIVGNFLTTGGTGIQKDLEHLAALGFTFLRNAKHAN